MSASTLTRPTSTVRTAPVVTPRVGSYVDTDGARRAPVRTGSYTGSATTIVGTYPGTSASTGSYVRSQR